MTVCSSDLRRAVETARLACGEPVLDARIRELDFGTLEGLTWSDLSRKVQDALVDFDAFEAPGGETIAGMRGRVFDFLSGLEPGDHLVFTHGGVIRLLMRTNGVDRAVDPGEFVWLDVERALVTD
jgi:probable phosphoglycerate mutase